MEIVMPKSISLKEAQSAQSYRRTKMRWWDTQDNAMMEWSTAMQSAFNREDSLLYKVMSNPIKYIPMQSLSVEDVTGKPYFEGDILEYGSYKNSSKKSVPCRYVLICSMETKQTVLKSLQPVMFSEFDIRKAKIVGNMYENPELF